MADKTMIEWSDATWSPITGCSVVSAGCKHCYAMKLAGSRLQHHPSRKGLTVDTKAGPVWTGEVRFNEGWLRQPLKWRKPRTIFVCAHADLFHEKVPDAWIDRVFAVMALAPHHAFQVLTKRSARMRAYLSDSQTLGRVMAASEALLDDSVERANKTAQRPLIDSGMMGTMFVARSGPKWLPTWPLPNVWLGVSAEDQEHAEARIPDLLMTPAAVRFLSAEPMLGQIDLVDTLFYRGHHGIAGRCYLRSAGAPADFIHPPKLDWVICGGESGAGARPMHPAWARLLRDQCAASGTAFLFKQWGAWGLAKPQPSGTLGAYAIATAPPYNDMRPATVIPVDSYPRQIALFGGAAVLERIGKKAAGRLLDGQEHNGMPEARAA